MNKSEIFWDKISGKYDTRAQKYGDTVYTSTVENTKKYLNTNDIVLDYACGTGIITNEFSVCAKKFMLLIYLLE